MRALVIITSLYNTYNPQRKLNHCMFSWLFMASYACTVLNAFSRRMDTVHVWMVIMGLSNISCTQTAWGQSIFLCVGLSTTSNYAYTRSQMGFNVAIVPYFPNMKMFLSIPGWIRYDQVLCNKMPGSDLCMIVWWLSLESRYTCHT